MEKKRVKLQHTQKYHGSIFNHVPVIIGILCMLDRRVYVGSSWNLRY